MTTPEAQAQTTDPPTEADFPSVTDGDMDAMAEAVVPTMREAAEDQDQEQRGPEVTTPGGVPAVPALTVGTTGTITAVSSVGLAAGPAVALAMAGAMVAGTAAVALVRAPRTAAAGPGAGPRRTRANSPTGTGTGAVSGGGGRRRASGPGTGGAARGGGGVRRAGQHAGQIRAARRQAAADAARRGRRETATDATRARRQVADARRAARQERRAHRDSASKAAGGARGGLSLSKGPKGPSVSRNGAQSRAGNGPSAGAGGKGKGGLWRAGRRAAAQTLARARRTVSSGTAGGKSDAADAPRGYLARRRAAYRQARDGIRDRWRAAAQTRIEERARNRARVRALRASAARYYARRALAVLLATPLGALSLALWPLARLLNLRPPRWGRAAYRAMVKAAIEARAARDAAAEEAHKQAEDERARDNRGPTGDVERASDAGATTPTTETPTEEPNVFDFREAAAEMLAQAQAAEPGGMMHVLAAIETLPEAMQMIADTFAAVAANCSPETMPLDPAVTEAMEELHKQLVVCVDAAEAIGEAFHLHHEADIARHTDGRTSEEMWDVARNQD